MASNVIVGSPGVWRCRDCGVSREIFATDLNRAKKAPRCKLCGGVMASPEEQEADIEFINRPRGYRCIGCGSLITAVETREMIAIVLARHLMLRPKCVNEYVENGSHLIRVSGVMLGIRETLRVEKTQDPKVKNSPWHIVGTSPNGMETTFSKWSTKISAEKHLDDLCSR